MYMKNPKHTPKIQIASRPFGTLRSITLRSITLHSITLRSITLRLLPLYLYVLRGILYFLILRELLMVQIHLPTLPVAVYLLQYGQFLQRTLQQVIVNLRQHYRKLRVLLQINTVVLMLVVVQMKFLVLVYNVLLIIADLQITEILLKFLTQ